MVSSPIGINVPNFKYTENVPEYRILHTITCEDAEKDIKKIISEFKPDLIGIRSLSICSEEFKTLAGVVRKESPKTAFIAGGPYPSA